MSNQDLKSDKPEQIQTDTGNHTGNGHSDDPESMLNEIYDEDEDITHQSNPVKPQRTLFQKSQNQNNEHDEPVKSKKFSNFFKSQTSRNEPPMTKTTTNNKSKAHVTKGLKVHHNKKEVNDVEYDDDDDDELVNTCEVNPLEGETYDDETDCNRIEIQNKKSTNSIIEREKNFKFKVGSKNKVSPSSDNPSFLSKDKNSKNLKSKIKLGKKTPLNTSGNEETYDDDEIQTEKDDKINITDEGSKIDLTETKDHETSFSFEEYDEDEDNEMFQARAENSQGHPNKSCKNTIIHKGSSVLSPTYFMNKLKGQEIKQKPKVKKSKCGNENRQENPKKDINNNELYDDDTFEIKGDESIDIDDGKNSFQKERKSNAEKNELNNIYDEDEEFQEQTRARENIKHTTLDNSATLTESVSIKPSKLETSKKYFNRKMKNLKIKEKHISDNFKRKIQKLKTFSTGARVDQVEKDEEIDEDDVDEGQEELQEIYDVDDDQENEAGVSTEIGGIGNITNEDKTKNKSSPRHVNKSVTKVDECSKNSKAKDQPITTGKEEMKNPDVPLLYEKRSYNFEEDDDDIYDDGGENEPYEEQIWGKESKTLSKTSSFTDGIVTENDDITESPSRLEPLAKFVNRNLKNLKKSKKLISERFNLAIQTLKEMSTNHNAVDRDEGIEEYESDDLDSLHETESNLHRSDEINDTCDSLNEKVKSGTSRLISNNLYDDNSKCSDGTECSIEGSIVKKNTNIISKSKTSNYFSDKPKGLNTKVKKISNNFKQVILNRNANRKEKNNNNSEQNENDKEGNDEEYCIEDDPTGEELFGNEMSDDIQIEPLANGKESEQSNFQSDKTYTKDRKKFTTGKPFRSKSSLKKMSLKNLTFKKSEKTVANPIVTETSSTSQQAGKDSQKDDNLGISSFPTNMLDEWFNNKMQLFMIQLQEKTTNSSSQSLESVLNDLNQVRITSTSKKREEGMETEVHKLTPKDLEKSIPTPTGSRSFPLIRKRYNVKMCLEYFDRVGDIASIETEILPNHQQKISIILGEANSHLIFESDLENLLKPKLQDKNTRENQSEFTEKAKSNDIKESKLNNKAIDSDIVRKSLPRNGKFEPQKKTEPNDKHKGQNSNNSQKIKSYNRRNQSESKDEKESKRNINENLKVPNKLTEKKFQHPKQPSLKNDKSKAVTPPSKGSLKITSEKQIPKREVNPDDSNQIEDDTVKVETKPTMKNDPNKSITESDSCPQLPRRKGENEN